MSWVLLLILASIAALFDYGPLGLWPVAPSAIAALAAWAGVNGSDRDLLVRVWFIGLVVDAIDPASSVFYTLSLLLCTVALLPMRHLFFRRSMLAWAIWAAVLVPALAISDAIATGYQPVGGWQAVISSAMLTGMLVLPVGFLLNVLPARVHPLGDTER